MLLEVINSRTNKLHHTTIKKKVANKETTIETAATQHVKKIYTETK